MAERYTVYQADGWHGEPDPPVILRTDDEDEAALRAGLRVDLSHPGGCNPHDAYAEDEDGEPVEPVESYRCDRCEEIVPWGEEGPIPTLDGEYWECPDHLATWVCDDCFAGMEALYGPDDEVEVQVT